MHKISLAILFGLASVSTISAQVQSNGVNENHTVSFRFETGKGQKGALDNGVDFRAYLDGEWLANVAKGSEKIKKKIIGKGKHTLRVYDGAKWIDAEVFKYDFDLDSDQRFKFKIWYDEANDFDWSVDLITNDCSVVESKLLNESVERVVRRGTPFVLPAGVKKTFEDTIETKNAVEISNSSEIERKISGHLAIIKAELEDTVQQKVKNSIVKTNRKLRSVTIEGDGKTKYVIAVVKQYQKGVAKISVGNKKINNVKFEVETGFDLRVEQVKE